MFYTGATILWPCYMQKQLTYSYGIFFLDYVKHILRQVEIYEIHNTVGMLAGRPRLEMVYIWIHVVNFYKSLIRQSS